jgi:5-methylcytosine-specific restriction endonuclease McrA
LPECACEGEAGGMSQSAYRRYKREICAARDGWVCHYCQKKLNSGTATLDHVVPRALGGTFRNENLRLACRKCNRRKGAQPPHAFHAYLMTGIRI